MIKDIIKNTIRNSIVYYHALKHERYYKSLLVKNNITNRYVNGEKEWIKKWSAFGIKANPVYYRLYSHYIGEDINIVPENICHDIIEPILNPFKYTKYYADKNIFDRLMPKGYLPRTLLRKMNGFYYDVDYHKINMSDDQLYDILAKANVNKIIIKPSVYGISGIGVRCFQKTGDSWTIYGGHDKLTLHYLETNYGYDFIIQDFLKQHESISHFCSTSVNTLHLTLYRSVKNDECVVPNAVIRIGNNGSVVDNAHAGGCYVGIDVNSGKLKHEVFNQYGQRYTTFNGIDFTIQQQIPSELWNKVLSFAKSIGTYVPHHRLLALDLMIDINGNPHVVEFNVEYYSIWFFQFSSGPAFGKYTDEIIEYCKTRLAKRETVVYL